MNVPMHSALPVLAAALWAVCERAGEGGMALAGR